MTLKLKPKDIKPIREQLLHEQDNTCAICQQHLNIEDAVLDHNHKTGEVRGVLHRLCNTFIGKIENNLVRNRIQAVQLQHILTNFVGYIHRKSDLIHPNYRTPEEKAESARKRAKLRRTQKKALTK